MPDDLQTVADDAFDAVYALQLLHFQPHPDDVMMNPELLEDSYRAARVMVRLTLTTLAELCESLKET